MLLNNVKDNWMDSKIEIQTKKFLKKNLRKENSVEESEKEEL